jgi:hypothetical protein
VIAATLSRGGRQRSHRWLRSIRRRGQRDLHSRSLPLASCNPRLIRRRVSNFHLHALRRNTAALLLLLRRRRRRVDAGRRGRTFDLAGRGEGPPGHEPSDRRRAASLSGILPGYPYKEG